VTQVGVVMGSISDWETMAHTCHVLDELTITYEKEVLSAHRTPDDMFAYAKTARERDLKILIAGAGGAAHLPGMIASQTTLPAIGIPVQSKALDGIDALLSIVQMPGGVPTETMAIGKAGATNAGIFAAQMLGAFDKQVANHLNEYRTNMQANENEMREDVARK